MSKILLVDDDPRITRATCRWLRWAGFEVDTTNRSYGVLNLVALTRPDVVVLDLNMPGLKGPELLELIRSDPDLSATRVLFFSAIEEYELSEVARQAGADGFVHKTSDLNALVRLLRAA